MKQLSLDKLKRVWLIAVIAAVFILPLAAYFSVFHGEISGSQDRWGAFGSYLSGIYGSLALVIVAYTTYLTQKQFKRQNEDGVFFRLFDSLQNRVESSVVQVDEVTLSGHQCLKHIAGRFYVELCEEAVDLARLLLCKSPESIGATQYAKLFEAMHGPAFYESFDKDRAAFIADVTSVDNFNERWEKLKFYIGSREYEPRKVREALRSLGCVSFYTIPFKERQRHYVAALSRVVSDYGELLDGYLSSLLLVAELANEAANRDVYVKYMQAQLTRYEVVIVFYMLAGQERALSNVMAIKKVGLLNRLRTFDCQSLMIDLPSTELIDTELEDLFSR